MEIVMATIRQVCAEYVGPMAGDIDINDCGTDCPGSPSPWVNVYPPVVGFTQRPSYTSGHIGRRPAGWDAVQKHRAEGEAMDAGCAGVTLAFLDYLSVRLGVRCTMHSGPTGGSDQRFYIGQIDCPEGWTGDEIARLQDKMGR